MGKDIEKPASPTNGSIGIVETKTLRLIEADRPLELQCGKTLGPIDVAYETYGELNAARDNVIYICHALSGNAHVAGYNSPDDKKPGWWDAMVGPGKGLDTNKYFVICSNILGGCSGTTGPSSTNPATGKAYGLDFPIITIADMVKVQKLLLEKLDIKQVLAVIGGSMGGMQALQWAISFPEFVKSAVVVASTTRLGAQSIAFDAVGRNAILADKNFADGRYRQQAGPDAGLAIARMIGHITYLSEETMHRKFGRQLRKAEEYSYDFNSEFAVETYLDHQGQVFVERFDANSYLYITKAMDYFDLERDYGSLQNAFAKTRAKFLIASFTSDWLFTPAQSEDMVDILVAGGKDVSYCNIDTPYGHDAFLLEPEVLGKLLSGFLDRTHEQISGVPADNIKRKTETAKTSEAVDEQFGPETSASSVEPLTAEGQGTRVRVDYEIIESLIEPKSRVLDIGCGDGELLTRLSCDKSIKGEGIEVAEDLVVLCVGRGLSIIQRDIERGLANYGDKSFDYVILSQTLQTLKEPKRVFIEMLRVGKKVVVSFPNFANWRCRLQLLVRGKAPQTGQLPFAWYDSPNIHFLSLKDFDRFCRKLGVKIEKRIPLIKTSLSPVRFAPNVFAEQVVYVTRKD